MKHVIICDVVFSFHLPSELIDYFNYRIDFESSISRKSNVNVDFIKKDSIEYNEKNFIDSYEPLFHTSGFYREIPGICTLRYDNDDKRIAVEYEERVLSSDNYLFVVVDATMQFVSLSLLYYNILPIHAAVIEYCGNGIIILGNSGAGKTTLEFSLINRQFNFFSDDIVFLDTSLMLHDSSEKILAIRNDVINILSLDLRKYNIKPVPGDKTLIHMDRYMGRNKKVTPIAILFPSLGQQEETLIRLLSETETLKRLIELTISSGLPITLKREYFLRLSQLARNVTAYEIRRSKKCDKQETEMICDDIISMCNLDI